MPKFLAPLFLVLCTLPNTARAQTFEIGDCYFAQFCGTWTARNVFCPELEPAVIGVCLRVEYDVSVEGVVVNQKVGGVPRDIVLFSCFGEGGSGYNYRNGLTFNNLSIGPDGISATAYRPFEGDRENPDFEMVTGSISGRNLSLTIEGGVGRFEGHMFEFETTFCNQVNCGDCSEPPGNGEPPEVETEVRWNTAEGAFSVAGNWDPQQVPTDGEVAIFDNPGTMNVMIGTAESRRAEIRRGSVHFIGGSYNLVHTSLENRSFTFGEDSSDLSFLFLRGHSLETVHSAIGLAGNLESIVDVEADSTWDIEGRLSVGMGGDGVVIIRPGGVVASGETRIGDLAGGTRSLIVVGETTKDLSAKGPTIPPVEDALFATGNLAVGLEGTGNLTIGDKGKVFGSEQVTIGAMPGAEGNVLVRGASHTAFWELTGNVDVGVEGTGTLTIIDGNSLDIPGNLNVGIRQGGQGTVDIMGGSGLTVEGILSVGIEGKGGLRVNHGMSSASAQIGAGTGGDGTVAIDTSPSVWSSGDIVLGAVIRNMVGTVIEVEGKGTLLMIQGVILAENKIITLNRGSRILGTGQIVGGSVVGDGMISPGLRPVKSFIANDKSGIDFSVPKQGTDDSRTLEIEGSLTLDGGTIEIFAAGSGAGEFDRLTVTGDASLTDTVIHFNFTDGYLPVAGDTFPFLTTTGTLTAANTVLEFEGVAEGFDFQINEENGMLMFEALNNALAIPQPGVGCGAGASSASSTEMLPLVLATLILLMACRRKA